MSPVGVGSGPWPYGRCPEPARPCPSMRVCTRFCWPAARRWGPRSCRAPFPALSPRRFQKCLGPLRGCEHAPPEPAGARPAPRPTRDVVRPFTLSALGDGGFRRLGCPGVPFCEVSVPSRCRPRPRTCADVLGTCLNPPVPERTGCTLFLRSAPWLSTLPATSSHEFFMSTVPGTLRGR